MSVYVIIAGLGSLAAAITFWPVMWEVRVLPYAVTAVCGTSLAGYWLALMALIDAVVASILVALVLLGAAGSASPLWLSTTRGLVTVLRGALLIMPLWSIVGALVVLTAPVACIRAMLHVPMMSAVVHIMFSMLIHGRV